ncbi:MAG: hypothetical protein MJZ97_11655 [Bacteroidales bacterium]|nr:hypothetical protein [Bacteroidales bacterium]
MYRGTTLFKCTECKHHFKADDIEYNCMVYSVPQPCPECGSIRTLPVSQHLLILVYRKIWNEMEKNE